MGEVDTGVDQRDHGGEEDRRQRQPHWSPVHGSISTPVAVVRCVAAAGATNLLVQRADPTWGYGHCAIPAGAQVQAITDLATWAATGIKPNN